MHTESSSAWIFRGSIILIALAVLLRVPTLTWGFVADDFVHQLVLDEGLEHPSLGPYSLYDWGGGETSVGEEFGVRRFWADSDWSVRFLRPISSAWLVLEHQMAKGSARAHAALGLILFVVLIGLVRVLLGSLGLATSTAWLGAALFAVEDSSVMSVAWRANRNTPVELLFLLLCLILCLEGRARGKLSWLILGLLAAVLACLSKESGLAAYPLFAWALLMPRARPDLVPSGTRRLLAGLSMGLVALYLGLYLQAGYGAHSQFYPTPWGEPLAYGRRALLNLVQLPAVLVTPYSADLAFRQPAFGWLGGLISMAALALLARVSGRTAFASSAGWFLLAWIVLTFLPTAGAPPSDRIYMVASVGSAGLLAQLLSGQALVGAFRWLLVILCVPLSLGGTAARASLAGEGFAFLRDVTTQAELGSPANGRRHALVLQSPSQLALLAQPAPSRILRQDPGLAWWPLQLGSRALRIERPSTNSLVLRTDDEPFFSLPLESIMRTGQETPVGRRYVTSLFEVEVLAVDSNGPRALRFEFDRPLESPGLLWVTWWGGRLRRTPLPAVGQSLVLERVSSPQALMP